MMVQAIKAAMGGLNVADMLWLWFMGAWAGEWAWLVGGCLLARVCARGGGVVHGQIAPPLQTKKGRRACSRSRTSSHPPHKIALLLLLVVTVVGVVGGLVTSVLLWSSQDGLKILLVDCHEGCQRNR